MGRIEKEGQMKEELSHMKGEVVKEIRKRDTGRGKLTCSMLVLFVLLGGMGWGVWHVASTGLWKIPVISNFAYQTPTPVRVVRPGVSLETVVQERAQTILTQRLQQGGGVLKNTALTFILEESAFTSTLQSSMESSGTEFFKVNQAQIAIEEQGTFELFLPLNNNAQQSAFLADLRVKVDKGVVDVQVEHVRLGSYLFPKILTRFFADMLIKPQLPKLNASLADAVEVQNISYATGRVTVDGTLVVTVVR